MRDKQKRYKRIVERDPMLKEFRTMFILFISFGWVSLLVNSIYFNITITLFTIALYLFLDWISTNTYYVEVKQ